MSGSPLAVPRGVSSRMRVGAFGVDGYPSLWMANLLWNIARWMEQLTVGWIAFSLTHSPFLVALIGFYRSLPLFVLGIFGGMLGDRYSRQRIVIALQVANVTCIVSFAILTLTGLLTYSELAIGELVMGMTMACDWPSRRTLTADLVGKANLTNAIALDSSGMNLSRTIGPLASGAVIAALSPSAAFGILALLYVGSGLLIGRIRVPSVPRVAKDHGVWHNLTDGIGEILRDQAIVGVLVVTVAMNLLFFPYQQLLPVVAVDILHSGSIGLGMLVAADGFGSLLGTLSIAAFASHRHNGRMYLGGSLIGGSALILFSFARVLPVAAGLLFLGGIGRAGFSAFQSVIILRNCSDEMRSRSMGILTLAIGVAPFGSLEYGGMAEAIGTSQAIFVNAIASVVLVAGIGSFMRRLRQT